jgi:glycosyltransferase involved in cell wall biosynthesis
VALIHPGTQYSAQLAHQLTRVGVLAEFWTGVAVSENGLLGPWLQRGATNPLAQLVSRRIIRGVPAGRIHLRPWHEIIAVSRQRLLGHEPQVVWHRRNAAFQRALPDEVLRRNDLVIGFDTSGWILAERCAALGRTFVLDQSIGHPSAKVAVYDAVRREFPEWGHELEQRRPETLAAENQEHALATRVVASSSFTKRTLVEHGVAAEKIVVNPYGVDISRFTPGPRVERAARPLRFVFVGQVSARKGIPLLLDVWSRLAPPDSELWLIGYVAPRAVPLVTGLRGVVVKGLVSRFDLPGLLRECDVLVLPSYFEGFAQVMPEAMASGLPVIATESSGAADLITDGADGFVIPTGDRAALQDRLQFFLRHPERVAPMGRAARQKAELFTWTAYGDRWAGIVRNLTAGRAAPPLPCS